MNIIIIINKLIKENQDLIMKLVLIFTVFIMSFVLGRTTKTFEYDKNIICKTEISNYDFIKNQNTLLMSELETLKKTYVELETKMKDMCSNAIDAERKANKKSCDDSIINIKKEYIKQKCKICK